MAVPSEAIVEARDELIVSPSDDPRNPSLRTAHFLRPLTNRPLFSSSSSSSSSSQTRPDLSVSFNGWLFPHKNWKTWVDRMIPKHQEDWKRVGILEPILNSTYTIVKAPDLIIDIAKKWRPETNTFVFSFAEATVSLEDVMISGGYSVLGCPVFFTRGSVVAEETREKRLEEERLALVRTRAKKASQNGWLRHFLAGAGSDVEHEAFLALWLSRYVFPGSAKDTVLKHLFPLAVHLARGRRIALGPAVLAGIYRDLTFLKRNLSGDPSWDVSLGGGGNCGGEVVLWAPFQLVLVWVWERFLLIQPERNLVLLGEPRLAHWHEVESNVEIFDFDSSGEYFLWRPYAVGMVTGNCAVRKSYGEQGEWHSVGTGLDEEFESFARCLRASELVGLDQFGGLFIEQYLPNRVARQFGFDQDVPGDVFRQNESIVIAWESYNKPIGGEIYFPSRFFTSGVTPRYLEWWERSKLGGGDGPKSVGVDVERIRQNDALASPPGFHRKYGGVKYGESSSVGDKSTLDKVFGSQDSVRGAEGRKTWREETGGALRIDNIVAHKYGNVIGGGYIPKLTFEKVVFPQGTEGSVDGRTRLRKENGGSLTIKDIDQTYGNVNGRSNVPDLTFKILPRGNDGSIDGRKRLREEPGESSHTSSIPRGYGNVKGGYVPKVTFERVILPRGTEGSVDGRKRLRKENNEPSYVGVLSEYGNIQNGGSGPKLTLKQVFGHLKTNKNMDGKKRLSEDNNGESTGFDSPQKNGNAKGKGFGLEDKLRLEKVFDSLDVDGGNVNGKEGLRGENGESCSFGSTQKDGNISRGQVFDLNGKSTLKEVLGSPQNMDESVNGRVNGIVVRDENGGFSQKYGNYSGGMIIDLEDHLSCPRGFLRKYGNVKGGNLGLKHESAPLKMVSFQGINDGGRRLKEGSDRSLPLGFWQKWVGVKGKETNTTAEEEDGLMLSEMVGSKDARGSVTENAAAI